MVQTTMENPIEKVGLDPHILSLLGENVYNLQVTLPMTPDGLPTKYVDAQKMLESGAIEGNVDVDVISQALVSVDYSEGYAIVNGLPFWDRLDGEPVAYHEVFKKYLHMKDTSATRSFIEVQRLTNVPIHTINNLAKAYHWRLRARSYDVYRAMELAEIKRRKIEELESEHSKKADSLIQLAEDHFASQVAEDLLTPRVALDIFNVGVKLKRLSTGLSPEQPFVKGEERNVINIGIQQGIISNDSNAPRGGTPVQDLSAVINILKTAGVLTEKDIEPVVDVEAEEVTDGPK